MRSIVYRELELHEAQLLGTIDRRESIDGTYWVSNGRLELDETRQEVVSWHEAQLTDYVARLQVLIGSGGAAFAAWDEHSLVGLGSLEPSGVGGNSSVMTLDMLYVSTAYRGKGIGRMLTQRVVDLARSRGATALYISATPTRATVDAYLHMGAKVLTAPDPAMFAREPLDIHLAMTIA